MSERNPVVLVLRPEQRRLIYAAAFCITKGLSATLAGLVVFGDAPKWFLAVSAAWGVLCPTEGLAIDNLHADKAD